MPFSIKNLRWLVIVVGAVLLTVVAAFLGYARLRGFHFHFDLPGHLGADISQTANGFTYSQSKEGHTLFTIHASKLVQYKGDQAELHDVTITLYGPEGSGRMDRIYGSDFKYDRKQGIARAEGAVQIDFSSPAGKPVGAAGAGQQAAGSPIHVTTSGVVFNQATGAATTDQRVNFVLTRASGSAVGADYNSKDGVLVLGSDVALSTTADPQTGKGIATVVHAEHAQILREQHQAYLIKAEATTAGRHTTSDQATVTFRPDGSAEHVEARGHVHLVTEDGADVHASSALIDLDPMSHPMAANLAGGITYYANDSGQTMQGSAVSGTLNFVSGPGNAQSQLKHAQFRDAVSFVLQQHSFAGDANGSATREMRASQLDIDFAPGKDGKAEAQQALGVGGAAVNLHDVPAKGPAKATMVSADQLLATLAHGRELKTLDGKGNAKIVDGAAPGPTSTSTGDTLHVTFAAPNVAASAHPAARASQEKNDQASAGGAQVETALLTGNVTLLQAPATDAVAPKDGHPQAPLHATAQRAEYHAGDQVLHLTGDPHLRSDTVAVTADKVDYRRDTGDATAMGNVKATYVQQPGEQAGPSLGGSGPVHVTADHAQLIRATDISVFYGAAGAPARMWQGGDAVTAPVLELARDDGTLDAHGAPGERTAVVHATLGSRIGPEAPGGAATGLGSAVAAASSGGHAAVSSAGSASANAPGRVPTRLTGVTLHYSDRERRADLRGLVTAEQPSGVLHADQAQVYLTPSQPNRPSQLDHMVATGHVDISQPGRHGTGEKLVYTAADGRYVLTGTAARPPRITDSQKGTTTGTALIFKSADDSVEVSSHPDSAQSSAASAGSTASSAAKRTVTDTHTPK